MLCTEVQMLILLAFLEPGASSIIGRDKWVSRLPSGNFRHLHPLFLTANLKMSSLKEAKLADPHQVNSLIASAICECRKDHPVSAIDPEEAKTMAKCIVQHLCDAGFAIRLERQS